ncbi:hypothetical protein H5410_034518 [Solanum commersonii]|uniref:26S proteasome regulatory subunit 6B homolog n=1 Tax=Solanum commersonii TaxID=4109 RepID=A0A9J5YVQ8_SOLCO|nr:hypothetical protein H5410_034518 [Solanum commersonii]
MASAMVLDPKPTPDLPATRPDLSSHDIPSENGEDDLYARLKSLQRQLEFIEIQEEYVKDELKNLRREHLRAQEEVKRIQSVPLVIGQFMEMIDQNNAIVGSTTGSNYYVRILSTINRELLKPSASVALHRHSNALVDVLPPEADSSISLLSQSEKPDVTYNDIGGCDIQKQEIREAVELPLTHHELYKQIGIDPPRGVLLYGPPGTGKTMLAKAVAHHTTAAFIRVVGSEFVQKYLGEELQTFIHTFGIELDTLLNDIVKEDPTNIDHLECTIVHFVAACSPQLFYLRCNFSSICNSLSQISLSGDIFYFLVRTDQGPRMVRDVFRLAKENAPAIIFIDEVDAIATARFDAQTGADREVQRILMELLNQMDGFDQTVNVKVIMATNRADTLDPALLRPGRLDRKIEFPLPDRRQKRLVFQVCTAKMNLGDEVDLEDYVSRPDKISAAEIAAICQEAGMHAVRKNRYVILPKDFEKGYRTNVKKPDTDFEFYK